MRFREFAPRKRNRDQKVNEILPAIAGMAASAAGGALARGALAAGGALARGATSLGGAALRGVGNLAAQGAKTVGQAAGSVGSAITGAAKSAGQAAGSVGSAIAGAGQEAGKALFTPQGMQRQMGTKPGQSAQQGTIPPVQIKPGVKILHPGLGSTKIKSIQGKDAVLDTQKELGQDVRVDQNELLAILGQGQQAKK